MKLLWTALRELRKDAGFVLLLILELSVGICFLASSGALLHRLGQQLTLTGTLHLQDAWWSDTAIESSDLPFYEMPQTMDVALNLDGKEQEAVLSALPAGMEHRLCFDLLMEGSADELPVVLRDTLAEKDTVGRRYEILLATGEEPLRIRVVGTYAGGIDDFQGDSFSGDVISGIYGDMIASQALGSTSTAGGLPADKTKRCALFYGRSQTAFSRWCPVTVGELDNEFLVAGKQSVFHGCRCGVCVIVTVRCMCQQDASHVHPAKTGGHL